MGKSVKIRLHPLIATSSFHTPQNLYSFPLSTVVAVMQLDNEIKSDPDTNSSFMTFLYNLKTEECDFNDYLRKIIREDLLYHFSWDGGRWGPTYRQSMVDIHIFSKCIYQIWKSPELDYTLYIQNIKNTLRRAHNRLHKRNSRLKQRKSKLSQTFKHFSPFT